MPRSIDALVNASLTFLEYPERGYQITGAGSLRHEQQHHRDRDGADGRVSLPPAGNTTPGAQGRTEHHRTGRARTSDLTKMLGVGRGNSQGEMAAVRVHFVPIRHVE